jgi:phosphoribosylamine--glycine ligase
VVLPRLQTDLLALLRAAAAGELADEPLDWSPTAYVNVVLASSGYPDSPRKGDRILGLDRVPTGVTVFHAGTAARDDVLDTAGGRVLSVVGSGHTVAEARARAYAGVETITFDGRQYRTDIALS